MHPDLRRVSPLVNLIYSNNAFILSIKRMHSMVCQWLQQSCPVMQVLRQVQLQATVRNHRHCSHTLLTALESVSA